MSYIHKIRDEDMLFSSIYIWQVILKGRDFFFDTPFSNNISNVKKIK
jgi:hypothetical protein